MMHLERDFGEGGRETDLPATVSSWLTDLARVRQGKLTMREFQRAFRALGLPKRDGKKMEMDQSMFNSFDTNGDGTRSPRDRPLSQSRFPMCRAFGRVGLSLALLHIRLCRCPRV